MTAGRRNTVEDKQKERRDDNLANRRLLRRTLILMAICGTDLHTRVGKAVESADHPA